jgi:hypothetical protein
MTDLEIISLIAFAVMTFMYFRAQKKAVYLSCMLVAVGLKEATVEIDLEDKTFTIKRIKPTN